MVTQRLRYRDAATVSDEYRKGTEVLRQQFVSHADSNGRFGLLVAEADIFIRSAYIVAREGPPSGGTANLRHRISGSTTGSSLTGDVTLPTVLHQVKDMPITEDNFIRRGELVEINIANIAGINAAVSCHVGWLPAVWGETQYKSYDSDRILYYDAARVSDEAGKGAEVLRQQVIPHTNGGAHALLVAESDCIITSASAYTITGSPTAGTVLLQKRNGANITSIAGITNIGSDNTVTILNLDGDIHVSRGEVIELVAANFAPGGTGISFHLGWMPDLWTSETQPHSYILSN